MQTPQNPTASAAACTAPTPAAQATPHNVDRIMAERFATGAPRSLAYKLGMRDTLEHRLYGTPLAASCFEPGHSLQAYEAGAAEGNAIARKLCEEVAA